MSEYHLRALFEQADEHDMDDGRRAYIRYHDMMMALANEYRCELPAVVGAFVALSPTNDYFNNLRGLVSMLRAQIDGVPLNTVNAGTYKHARDRAALYLTGTPFLSHAKGPKTRNFYVNILDPTDTWSVTVDGHMYWAWMGSSGTMRQAKVTKSVYDTIAHDIRSVARLHHMIPHQMQATLWFTRKRLSNTVYDPQFSLFDDRSIVGAQKTTFSVDEILPFDQEK